MKIHYIGQLATGPRARWRHKIASKRHKQSHIATKLQHSWGGENHKYQKSSWNMFKYDIKTMRLQNCINIRLFSYDQVQATQIDSKVN